MEQKREKEQEDGKNREGPYEPSSKSLYFVLLEMEDMERIDLELTKMIMIAV